MCVAYRTVPTLGCALIVVALLGLFLVCGCGKPDFRDTLPLAPVHGTVSYRGKPLGDGQVFFVPEKDSFGVITSSPIHNDGSYEMKSCGREGAVVGINRVVVRVYAERRGRQSGVAQAVVIPEKYTYADQTPLRFDVKPSQNEYNIILE